MILTTLWQVVQLVERGHSVPKSSNTLGLHIFVLVNSWKQKLSLDLKMGWHLPYFCILSFLFSLKIWPSLLVITLPLLFNCHSFHYYYFAGHKLFDCTFSVCVLSLYHSVFIVFYSYHCCNRKMIRNFKLEGKIVPSEVTVGILQQAMQQSENKKFIIDGFPRNEENLAKFENTVRSELHYINLHFNYQFT